MLPRWSMGSSARVQPPPQVSCSFPSSDTAHPEGTALRFGVLWVHKAFLVGLWDPQKCYNPVQKG